MAETEVVIAVQMLSFMTAAVIEEYHTAMPKPTDYTEEVSAERFGGSLGAVDASVSLEARSTVIDIVLHPV